jgi:hypothetical protein
MSSLGTGTHGNGSLPDASSLGFSMRLQVDRWIDFDNQVDRRL